MYGDRMELNKLLVEKANLLIQLKEQVSKEKLGKTSCNNIEIAIRNGRSLESVKVNAADQAKYTTLIQQHGEKLAEVDEKISNAQASITTVFELSPLNPWAK